MFNKISIGSIRFLFLTVFLFSLSESTMATSSKQKSEVQETLNYKVIYTLEKARYDGGKIYYVLIDPVDLSSGAFKVSIKKTIREIVSEKGDKISIEIFDNRNALEIHYKGYGLGTLQRPLNKQETKEIAEHHIAGFSGELKSEAYLNTLYFFQGAFKDHPRIGKYVEYGVEFNPKSQ